MGTRESISSSFSSDVVLASAARTATGNSGLLTSYGWARQLIMQVAVTASSGTVPTLDVILEATMDGGTTFRTLMTFTQVVGITSQTIAYELPFSDTLRVKYTIGGTTPSFTFATTLFAKA